MKKPCIIANLVMIYEISIHYSMHIYKWSGRSYTPRHLFEADQRPKPAILWCNQENHLLQPDEGEYFQESCINRNQQSESNFTNTKREHHNMLPTKHYLYPPVEAQTRAPLSNNIWTHWGRLWRAARCNGVAPLLSLMLTKREYPLQICSYIIQS